MEFPHKFQTAKKSGGGSQVASAGNSASRSTKQGRRSVKLTHSQVAIAKKLGVPLEEYAKVCEGLRTWLIRTPAQDETRETETRRKPWAPPSHLDAPTHQMGMCIVGYELQCAAKKTR